MSDNAWGATLLLRPPRNFDGWNQEENRTTIGVSGYSVGWIAVQFVEDDYKDTYLYEDIEGLWVAYGAEAEPTVIDVPMDLRENANAKWSCDN